MTVRTCWMAGLLVGLAAVSAHAQQGRGQGRFGQFGGGSTGLLSMPEVRAELKITDDQVTKIEDLAAKYREESRSLFQRPEGDNPPTDEERQRRREERAKKLQELETKIDQELTSILDAKQVSRLKQLRLQRMGAVALSRADVAKELGLSDQQKEQIRKIQAESRGQRGGGNFRDLSDDERRARLEELRKQREKTESDVLAVLTDAQKKKLAEMKGTEFKFPEPKRGGQGRRRNQDA